MYFLSVFCLCGCDNWHGVLGLQKRACSSSYSCKWERHGNNTLKGMENTQKNCTDRWEDRMTLSGASREFWGVTDTSPNGDLTTNWVVPSIEDVPSRNPQTLCRCSLDPEWELEWLLAESSGVEIGKRVVKLGGIGHFQLLHSVAGDEL